MLSEAETFFLQLVHHAVKDGDDAVGFPLSDRCQPATEILCLKQVHTTGDGVQGFDDFPIEIKQIDQTERNDAFYQIKPPSVFLCSNEQQYNPYHQQQKCQDKEKGSKLEAIGISTGLLDRHGKEIVTGDKVLLTNSSIDGIVLYNRYAGSFGVFYSYSMWYGDNPYNPDSYGKYISIPADNGMRMEIEILTTKDEED